MKEYFDRSVLMNPLSAYLGWIVMKLYYQSKYWGKHLRIGYLSMVRRTVFGCYNFIGKSVTLGDSVMGDFSYISDNCTITGTTIGKYCSIGPNVKTAPGRHPTKVIVSTHPSLFSGPRFLLKSFVESDTYPGNLPVTIGNDVWIGANSIILDGVTIHNGAIIAANSIVTVDVDTYTIVGGSPAKPIRKRFSDAQIARLQQISWWDQSQEWIRAHIADFQDIETFTKL